MKLPSFSDRPLVIHRLLIGFALLLVAWSAYLQLWRGAYYHRIASSQYFRDVQQPAPRGDILDAAGRTLVRSLERRSISITPSQVRDADRRELRKSLARLGVPVALQNKALNGRSKVSVFLAGPYMSSELGALARMRGVYPQPVITRASSATPGAEAFIGRVDNSGKPQGGLERSLDAQLNGTPGLVRMVRDPSGNRYNEFPVSELRQRVPGNTVVLTINGGLQGIAEQAIRDAVVEREARGGDIVIVDPRTGAIRALASYTSELGFRTTDAVTSPFEPGSSIKPLLVSRLLELGKARETDVVVTGRELMLPWRREPLEDIHVADSMTLREVVKYSSNIGMVKFTTRLSFREQFEAFRDFGLGIPTGVGLPGEAAGRLTSPSAWGQPTQAATAIGYEISVTSLQLAMAYAAIANGGLLLEPTLIAELRSPDGGILFRHDTRVIRRVMSPGIAAQVRGMLREVVEGGSASGAEISLGQLAGKTGTARRVSAGQGYRDGQYTATFAGMFPVSDPQFVIVVRLVDPKGMYGGSTAAPVTAAVLKAAAVAQDAALDRATLVAQSGSASVGLRSPGGKPDSAKADLTASGYDVAGAAAGGDDDFAEDERIAARAVEEEKPVARVVDLRKAAQSRAAVSVPRPVPSVRGLPLREAVFLLHQAGFKVKLQSTSEGNPPGYTNPAAGAIRKPGELVLLYSHK